MGLYSQLKFRQTTVIIFGFISFLIGLGLARLRLPMSGWFVIFLIPALLLNLHSKTLLSLSFVILFGLSFGMWRGATYLKQLDLYQQLLKRQVVLVGQADNSGDYSKGSQLSFDLVSIQAQQPQRIKLPGKIGAKGYGENAVFRGDKVQVSGKLYPARGSRQATTSFAKIKVLERSSSTINSLRRRFEAGMLSALPEPLASFGLGILIGQRSTLPQSVNDELSAAGLTHIVAVSGYNLTIIISAVYLLTKKFSKYQATLGSALLILLFVIFVGASASIIRAAIVSMLSLAAAYYGRTFRPLLLILLAAALTAGWSPAYLWSDIGWYLSFLAFYGVLVLAPLVISRWKQGRQPGLVGLLIVETLAAQLMTMPIIMYIFGQVSLVALPANILVVPLVPLAMLFSFVAALAGMIIPAVAGWLAWPARILMTYMLDMVSLAARVPHALSLQSLKLSQMIGLYGLIAFICWLLWFKTRHKNDIITDIDE